MSNATRERETRVFYRVTNEFLRFDIRGFRETILLGKKKKEREKKTEDAATFAFQRGTRTLVGGISQESWPDLCARGAARGRLPAKGDPCVISSPSANDGTRLESTKCHYYAGRQTDGDPRAGAGAKRLH